MAVTQYIGARYVPLFAEPLEWDNLREYEPLTIVLHQGNSYTSRQFVPKGTPIDNQQFWVITGNYNAQIEQYRNEVEALTSQTIRSFDNISELRESGLRSGVVQTMGYHTAGDGGSAFYHIDATHSTPDDYGTITLNNGSYAHMVYSGGVCPEQFGAQVSSGDCSDIFNWMFNEMPHDVVALTSGASYTVLKPLVIKKTLYLEGNGAEIKSLTRECALQTDLSENYPDIHSAMFGEYSNIVINAPQATVSYENKYGYKGLIKNMQILNAANKGFVHTRGYEMVYQNIRVEGTSISTIGYTLNSTDYHLENIFGVDCRTGIVLNGAAIFINTAHLWIHDRSLFNGSQMIVMNNTNDFFMSDVYIDTYEKGIVLNDSAKLAVNGLYMYQNSANIPEGAQSYTLYAKNDVLTSPLSIVNANLHGSNTAPDSLSFFNHKTFYGNVNFTGYSNMKNPVPYSNCNVISDSIINEKCSVVSGGIYTNPLRFATTIKITNTTASGNVDALTLPDQISVANQAFSVVYSNSQYLTNSVVGYGYLNGESRKLTLSIPATINGTVYAAFNTPLFKQFI